MLAVYTHAVVAYLCWLRVGLNDPENFHEFTRLLSRLKTSNQLTDLVQVPVYAEWLDLLGNITVETCRQGNVRPPHFPLLSYFWVLT